MMRFLFFFLFAVAGFAQAPINESPVTEIQCNHRDCLGSGYVVFREQKQIAELQCEWGDCRTQGWRFRDDNGLWVQGVCKGVGSDRNCFDDGFIERDMRSGQVLADTRCYGGGCLKDGYTTRFYNGNSMVVDCRYGDCHKNGWTTTYNNGEVFEAVCNNPFDMEDPDCFKDGWVIRRRH